MAKKAEITFDDLSLFVVDADPSTSGNGIAAPLDSIAFFQGTQYKKIGAGDEDWELEDPFENAATFPIGNAIVVPQNVTDLSFDSAQYRAGIIEGYIERVYTGPDSALIARVVLDVGYRGGVSPTWVLTQDTSLEDPGVTFSVTSGGQVQYVSTNISGTESVSRFVYRVRRYKI
jgi:hypothetical protein